MTLLEEALETIDKDQSNLIWPCVKQKTLNIHKKVRAICSGLGLDVVEVMSELPHTDNGFLKDYETRTLIVNALNRAAEKFKSVDQYD